jgi:hypothetical protein
MTTPSNALVPVTTDEAISLGKILAQSGYFADSKEAAQAITKIIAGKELGIGPVAAMTGIHVIKGKISLSANLIAAIIKRSGRYDYRVKRLDAEVCVLEFTDGGKPAGESSFTMKDAAAAGLTNENLRKFPRNMLFARAMSNGAKWYCPDCFIAPVYTPEELQADDHAAEPAAAAPVIEQPAQQSPAPKALPRTGEELRVRLETFDRRLAEEGAIRPGDLLTHIQTTAAHKDWPEDFGQWDERTLSEAFNEAREYARQARERLALAVVGGAGD